MSGFLLVGLQVRLQDAAAAVPVSIGLWSGSHRSSPQRADSAGRREPIAPAAGGQDSTVGRPRRAANEYRSTPARLASVGYRQEWPMLSHPGRRDATAIAHEAFSAKTGWEPGRRGRSLLRFGRL